MTGIEGLIERVEQATGNDPELFREAWHACCADEAEPFSAELAAEARFFALVSVEAFVDAALGLMERVLPMAGWERIIQPDNTVLVYVWGEDSPGKAFEKASGTALALTLATLRALQSKPEGDAR